MRVYLDDRRKAPEDWILVKTPEEAINLLSSGSVKEISLNHDLGLPDKTGYDVLLWIEFEVLTNNFVPPNIIIHTSNPSARIKMEWAVGAIKKFHKENIRDKDAG
jgi:hypothetical protein